MTAVRFLAFAGEPERLNQFLSGLVPDGRRPPRLNRIFDAPDLVVFASPETPYLELQEERGLLLGRLFRASDSWDRIETLSLSESRHAAWSGGKSLLAGSWGNYVVFLRDEHRVAVVRDPSAAVPAYHCDLDGVQAHFSDLDLCGDLGLDTVPVDEEFLRQWLTWPYLRTARTGLAGIKELVPGTIYRSGDANRSIETAWTPWAAAAPDRRIMAFEDAAARVRATVLGTVAAQLADPDRLLLELSGGLDSSIVAAALAASGMRVPAVNFATLMPDGDERSYARIVATTMGFHLTEVEEDRRPLDLRPAGQGMLRPPLSPVLQPLNRALCDHARRSGAQGFVTGAGGDNLFCYLTTAAPILDAVRDLGLVRALRSTLGDVATMGGCTIWTAGRYALRKRLAQGRRPAWKEDRRFLGDEAVAERMDPHPWLEAPVDAPPGKREHVASLVRAHHFMEPQYLSGERLIHPLINQPLMELCLRIPTWLWVRGGRNRAVARRAFEDLLPAEAIHRRTKGRLESMCARAFTENRRPLEELLLGGELAARRLIEVPAVESYLKGTGPAPDEDYFRLFDLASLELWLRARAR
jgi:asparagine synthase (glutamine-hydrolysing)